MTQLQRLESQITPPPRKRGIPLVTLPALDRPVYERPRVGETIQEFLDRTGWSSQGLPVVVGEVLPDGECVPVLRARWTEKVRRRKLVVMARPLGGGGGGSRQVGAILAMIALIVVANVAAPMIGGAMGGALGIGAKAWTSIASALIVAGGSMLISHFMSPKSGAKGDPETLYTASLSGNRARPQQPIPVHYGRLKFNPDFGGQPWAEFVGKDQIFHAEYVLGIGEFVIHEIGVGDTPIWKAVGGNQTGFENFQHEVVAPGVDLTLFPVNAVTAGEVSGQEFPEPIPPTNGVAQWVGPFIINPAGSLGREVSIDVAFPGGCFYQDPDDGKVKYAGNTLLSQYRYVDDAGVPVGGINAPWQTLVTRAFSAASQAPVRFTVRTTLPQAGRIQVRAAVQNKVFRNNGTNVMIWVGARMFLQGPNARPNVSRMAIRMVADEQLSGYSQQNLYVIATRKIPVWNGTSWPLTATQNPIWAFLDMWSNDLYGGGMPLAKADLATLAQEAADTDARGETFNHRFTSQDTVLSLLSAIAQSIGAKPVILWDVLSIHRDKPALLPERVFTDFEIVRGSFSGTWLLQDDDSSDGTIVEYIEEQIWQPADAPSSATVTELLKPARVQIPGVTKRAQAVRLARLLNNSNQLRRKTIDITVRSEGKVLRYGMCIAVQSHLPSTWGASARVDLYSAGSRTMVLRDPLPWDLTATEHFITVRQRNGRYWGPVKVTRGGADNILVVDAPDLASVQGQQGITLVNAVFRSDEDDDATIAFSPGEPREFVGLLTQMKNAGPDHFRVTLIPQDMEVFDTSGPIPPLPEPPPLAIPTMAGEVQGLLVSYVQEGLALRLGATWQPDPGSSFYQAQITYDEGTVWQPVYSNGADAAFSMGGLPDADLWLRVRGVRRTGSGPDMPGPWTVPQIIVSPGIVRSAEYLNLTVDYTDLTPGAQAEIEQQIAAEVEAARAPLQAAIDGEISNRAAAVAAESLARSTADGNLAGQISAVVTQADDLAAAVQAETTARTNADSALANDITTVAAMAAAAGRVYRQAAPPANPQNGWLWIESDNQNHPWVWDSTLAQWVDARDAYIGVVAASVTSEATARADADDAIATLVDAVEAKTDAGTAEARIRFSAIAGTGDVASIIHLEAKATPSGLFPGAFASAAMRIQVKTDGTSEIVFQANAFKVQTTSANIAPFAVVGADIYLQGVTRVAQTIRSANVNTAGVPFMQVDFENGRILVSDNT